MFQVDLYASYEDLESDVAEVNKQNIHLVAIFTVSIQKYL